MQGGYSQLVEELVTAGGSKPLIHAAHVFAVPLTRARFRLNVGVIVGGDSNILKRPDTNLIGSNYGVMYVDSIGICYTVLSNPTYRIVRVVAVVAVLQTLSGLLMQGLEGARWVICKLWRRCCQAALSYR